MGGLSLRLPLRFLRGNYSRLLLTVIALACGVAQVSGNAMVGRAALQSFLDIIDTVAGRAALQVSADGALFSEDVAKAVATVPGVERVVPMVTSTAFTTGSDGELLGVQGIDLSDTAAVQVYEMRSGDGIQLSDPKILLPDSVVLTHTFADHHGLTPGMPITLDTPRGQHRFTVRALLEPEGVARMFEGNLVVMDLLAAQAAFARSGLINRLDVVVGRGETLDSVSHAIAGVLPEGLHVGTPDQRKADLHAVMRSIQLLLSALDLVGVGAGFLIAFNSLSTIFERRAWQIGVLRAIGVRPRAVWWELIKESLLLGIAGVLLGLPLGLGLEYLVLPQATTAAALSAKVATPTSAMTIDGGAMALGAAVGLLAAVLAAWLPAWRAARAGVAETMRGRGVEQRGLRGATRWGVRLVVGIAIVVTVVLQVRLQSGAWGLIATGLIALGTALAARPLTDLTRSPLLRGFRWIAGPTGHFAMANIAQNPRRTALTVAVIGVGVGAVLWLWTVAGSFERSVIAVLTQAMRADLVVNSSHIQSGFLEAPVDEELATQLQALPGVLSVAGDRVSDWHLGGGAIAIDAFDPAYFTDPQFGQWPLFGRRLPDVWDAVARGEAAIASSNFVLNLQRGVGDTVTLDTPNGPLSLRIAGMVTHFTSPRGTIIMSRDVYKRYWHDPQVTRIFVRTTPGTDPGAVRSTIARTLGRAYGLNVLSSAELVEYFASQVRRAFAAFYVLAGLVLFVVLVGVADALAAGVIERTRELGAIRFVGVQRRHVRRMVLMEGAVLAFLGLVLAAASGLALGTLWVKATFPYLFGWVIEMHFPWGHALRTVLLTVAACLLAAVAPARHAADLEPAAALRYE